jgi:hypothetical protein
VASGILVADPGRGGHAMSNRRETLTVAVEKQVLWVGAEAYPVNNIARAQTIELKPGRARAVFGCLGLGLLWVALAAAAAFAIITLELDDDNPSLVRALPFIVAAGLILINFIGLVRKLARPTLYALIIETSGNPHAALVTADERLLRVIVKSIMGAINNPQVSYGPVSVTSYEIGKIEKLGNLGAHGNVGTMN